MNRRKMMLWSFLLLTLYSGGIYWKDTAYGEAAYYDPIDPSKEIKPLDPDMSKATKSSDVKETAGGKKTEKAVSEVKKEVKKADGTKLKREQKQKLLIDDSFFTKNSTVVGPNNHHPTGGGGESSDGNSSLMELAAALSGVGIFGRSSM